MNAELPLRCALAALLAAAAAAAPAAETDPDRIMQHAYEVRGGDDAFSRLRFSFEYDGGKSATLTLVMAYKRYPAAAEVDSRVVMFNEFPPDRKDVAYLGWFYRPEQNRDAEQWLYLPELRQARKLSRRQREEVLPGLKRRPEADEFSVSELDEDVLVPRDPRRDRHTLLETTTLGGQPVYSVESVPRAGDASPYGRIVAWIAQENYVPLRTEYYNRHQSLVKTLTYSWRQVGGEWVWDRVTAVNAINGNRTVLEQTDVRVNLGLPDELFAKRVLDQGGDGFVHRVERYFR